MESDWHIGSGAGISGNIDRQVIKDKDGFPYIPAKTLTGIWRDACEQVAFGLDEGDEFGAWNQYVLFLFGEQPALNQDQSALNQPIPSALEIRPAYLDLGIKQKILSCTPASQQALKDAVTFVKASNSINHSSGCTEERFLRFEEMTRLGCLLRTECKLNLENLKDENQKKCAFALLVASAKLVDKLGGKRRRGTGKCSWRLGTEEQHKNKKVINYVEEIDSLTWIENNELPTPPVLSNKKGKDSFYIEESEKSKVQYSSQKRWFKIPLVINTILPVIVKDKTVGNVVKTLDYIPGTSLLPIVARKLGQLGFDVKEAISQKELIVTNATIEINKKSGKPVPFAIFYDKIDGGFEKKQAVCNKFNDEDLQEFRHRQLKGYRQGYVDLSNVKNSLPSYIEVKKIFQTHNTIQDKFQRPTTEVGGIYSYQAIESELVFRAELRIKTFLPTEDKNINSEKRKGKKRGKRNKINKDNNQPTVNIFTQLKENLSIQEKIGTSKKDDYGLVNIKVEKSIEISSINDSKIEKISESITVWLLSDMLIRNDNLKTTISVDDFRKLLQQEINNNQEQANHIELDIVSEKTYLRHKRIESWQSRWNLPRPSLVSFMAGSCLELKIKNKKEIDLQVLRHLEIYGIGERTAEGFGQISFNNPLLANPLSKLSSSLKKESSSAKTNNAKIQNHQFARLIEIEAWRKAIAKEAMTLASNDDLREQFLGIKIEDKKSYPSMSQLGNLRSLVRQVQNFDDAGIVINWIASLKKKDNGDKWRNTSDGLNKLIILFEDPQQIWKDLSFEKNIELKNLIIRDIEEGLLKEELWSEAIKASIFECILAHKRELENSNNSQNI